MAWGGSVSQQKKRLAITAMTPSSGGLPTGEGEALALLGVGYLKPVCPEECPPGCAGGARWA